MKFNTKSETDPEVCRKHQVAWYFLHNTLESAWRYDFDRKLHEELERERERDGEGVGDEAYLY